MPCPITTLRNTLKFVGTVSLGLFTGTSYSLGALSLPALLLLPSAPQAQHAFVSLSRTSRRHLRTLASISALSFPLAYFLSPARAKHPYLLWTGLTAAVAAIAPDLALAGGSADALVSEDQQVNGEMVERAVRKTQMSEVVKTVIGGLGFAMAVVGVWGDGA